MLYFVMCIQGIDAHLICIFPGQMTISQLRLHCNIFMTVPSQDLDFQRHVSVLFDVQ